MILKNGRVVFEDRVEMADVCVEDGKIVAIGEDLNGAETLDLEGKYLVPGGIETHTHLQLEAMGTVTADDFYTGTKAALFGGTTCVLDFATQFHGQTMMEGLRHWHQKADNRSFIHYGFHMAFTEYTEALVHEMEEMVKQGITSFKMYMAYKNNMMVNDAQIYRVLKKAKELGVTVGFHCENGDIIDELVKQFISEGKKTPYYHALSRPAALESEAIYRLCTIAKELDAPIYIVHLSTEEGLEVALEMRRRGTKVTLETCVQYLYLDDHVYGSAADSPFEAAKYVCSPPLRKKEDQDALLSGLQNEEIQFVGTDHCSFNMSGQKEMGREDFRHIPNGMPGIEMRMLLLFSKMVEQPKDMVRFAKVSSTNAAKYFGLYPQKGVIQVGSDADLVVIDPEPRTEVRLEDLHENVDYSPYEGISYHGRIAHVFLDGKEVVRDGELIMESPMGKYLKRNLPMLDLEENR